VKLLITSAAELDLEEIEAYISSDNPIAADRFLELLSDRFKLIADMPGIGGRRDKYVRGARSIAEGDVNSKSATSKCSVNKFALLKRDKCSIL
jgi:plasmid stabilization system protein ParE